MRKISRGSAAALTAALAFAACASCFSERTTTAPNTDVTGACQLSDASVLAGASGAFIVIRNFAFHPDTLRVARGTRVTWVNCDANADPHTTTADGGAWNSPFITPGTTYQRVFDQVGTFSYHCTPHPFMKATVIVQ
jgi:plastocyanin